MIVTIDLELKQAKQKIRELEQELESRNQPQAVNHPTQRNRSKKDEIRERDEAAYVLLRQELIACEESPRRLPYGELVGIVTRGMSKRGVDMSETTARQTLKRVESKHRKYFETCLVEPPKKAGYNARGKPRAPIKYLYATDALEAELMQPSSLPRCSHANPDGGGFDICL